MSNPDHAAVPVQIEDNTRFEITYEGQKPSRKGKAPANRGNRETVESIVVAIVLALLFRSFVAEAFVIPTGSMAPTLQGRHLDVKCPECDYRYRAGASIENNAGGGQVTHTVCPICRFKHEVQETTKTNEWSFNGDRILVSKFAYALAEPKRWEVIVFKFPGNAKQNYIKRLVGLPGEFIKVYCGDVFVAKEPGADYEIARKPPERQLAMMQLVDDTKYVAKSFIKGRVPGRWQPWVPGQGDMELIPYGGMNTFFDGQNEEDTYLRYRHLSFEDDPRWTETLWDQLKGYTEDQVDPLPDGALISGLGEYQSLLRLITDHYAYNDRDASSLERVNPIVRQGPHWVGDLTLEAGVNIKSDTGELLLKAVEGGFHFNCRIDVSTGEARLSIEDTHQKGKQQCGFGESKVAVVKAPTNLKGKGLHWVRFANVDDQIRLWIDNQLVEFDKKTTYHIPGPRVPYAHPLPPPGDGILTHRFLDPGDLAPLGVGGKGLAMDISRIRVFRDVYYVALNESIGDREYDYDNTPVSDVRNMHDAENWGPDSVFHNRRSVEFPVAEGTYFPMGDNSPQSLDARLWGGMQPDGREIPSHVERRLLIGRAFVVYWPHGWRLPFIKDHRFSFPIIPNFERMGFIR